jgi:hypothetical protein
MASRADLAVPPRGPRTFDEAFAEFNLTQEERTAMVWHLAAIRTRKLIETLLPGPAVDPRLLDVLRDGRQ